MPKTSKKLPQLSLFFPAYNEQENIIRAIQEALVVLPSVAKVYEVIVINDGSLDDTKKLALSLARKNPHVRVVSQRNRGYGGALKRGFQAARYDWIFFTDSDLQFNLNELKKLVKQTDLNDMVLGYRTNRAEGLKRVTLAKLLKIWNRLFLGFPAQIKDIDCAFKLIRKEVIRAVEPLMSDGAMISTELLLKAHHANFKYTQVGVKHYRRKYGQPTGSNWKVIARAVMETFILRKKLLRQQLRAIQPLHASS